MTPTYDKKKASALLVRLSAKTLFSSAGHHVLALNTWP